MAALQLRLGGGGPTALDLTATVLSALGAARWPPSCGRPGEVAGWRWQPVRWPGSGRTRWPGTRCGSWGSAMPPCAPDSSPWSAAHEPSEGGRALHVRSAGAGPRHGLVGVTRDRLFRRPLPRPAGGLVDRGRGVLPGRRRRPERGSAPPHWRTGAHRPGVAHRRSPLAVRQLWLGFRLAAEVGDASQWRTRLRGPALRLLPRHAAHPARRADRSVRGVGRRDVVGHVLFAGVLVAVGAGLLRALWMAGPGRVGCCRWPSPWASWSSRSSTQPFLGRVTGSTVATGCTSPSSSFPSLPWPSPRNPSTSWPMTDGGPGPRRGGTPHRPLDRTGRNRGLVAAGIGVLAATLLTVGAAHAGGVPASPTFFSGWGDPNAPSRGGPGDGRPPPDRRLRRLLDLL